MHNFTPFNFDDEATPVRSSAKEVQASPSGWRGASLNKGKLYLFLSIASLIAYVTWVLFTSWTPTLMIVFTQVILLLSVISLPPSGHPARRIYIASIVVSFVTISLPFIAFVGLLLQIFILWS